MRQMATIPKNQYIQIHFLYVAHRRTSHATSRVIFNQLFSVVCRRVAYVARIQTINLYS